MTDAENVNTGDSVFEKALREERKRLMNVNAAVAVKTIWGEQDREKKGRRALTAIGADKLHVVIDTVINTA